MCANLSVVSGGSEVLLIDAVGDCGTLMWGMTCFDCLKLGVTLSYLFFVGLHIF